LVRRREERSVVTVSPPPHSFASSSSFTGAGTLFRGEGVSAAAHSVFHIFPCTRCLGVSSPLKSAAYEYSV
jgi:hypothetical protein